MKRLAVLLTALGMLVTSTVLVIGASTQTASANECSGSTWSSGKLRVLGRAKKDLSSVYSKRNSNSRQSSRLNITLTTNSEVSTTVSTEFSYTAKAVVAEVEGKLGYSVTMKVGRGQSMTNELLVEPLKYGRTKWQTIRTKVQKYQTRDYGTSCKRQTRILWTLNAITSKVHFAECQDRRNICTPY